MDSNALSQAEFYTRWVLEDWSTIRWDVWRTFGESTEKTVGSNWKKASDTKVLYESISFWISFWRKSYPSNEIIVSYEDFQRTGCNWYAKTTDKYRSRSSYCQLTKRYATKTRQWYFTLHKMLSSCRIGNQKFIMIGLNSICNRRMLSIEQYWTAITCNLISKISADITRGMQLSRFWMDQKSI